MLGIIGAMDVEVKKLREMMEDPEIQTVAGMTFYQGTIKGKAEMCIRDRYRRADRNGGGKKAGSVENGYRKRRAGIWGMDEGEKDRKILFKGLRIRPWKGRGEG